MRIDRIVAVFAVLCCVAACQTSSKSSNVKVIGGVEIPSSQLRAVVELSRGDGRCTGTFVNDTTVITAAHCVDLNNAAGGVTVQGISSVNVFFRRPIRL